VEARNASVFFDFFFFFLAARHVLGCFAMCCKPSLDALATHCMRRSSEEGSMRRSRGACCGWGGLALAAGYGKVEWV